MLPHSRIHASFGHRSDKIGWEIALASNPGSLQHFVLAR